MRSLAYCLATWFGCGYAPKAPGTAGTLGGLAVAFAIDRFFGWPPLAYAVLALVALWPAIWSATFVARDQARKDPGLVVIDEVVGVWITLAGATRLNWQSWALAFALFRIFDIWKPWPARQLEALPDGTGIVMDDAMAGIYGALVLFTAGWFNLY